MLLTALIVLTTLLPRADGAAAIGGEVTARIAAMSAIGATSDAAPVFSGEARAVSNWREQAGAALRPASLALVARYAATEPAFVARCVKLNNYWCIKRARWAGEIGADAEGHTAFATAADAADAAAQLLRRYYRSLGRRTALSIVRRWAPAECRPAGGSVSAAAAAAVPRAIAPGGIRKTLRARYLARYSRGGAPKQALASRGGLRIQPWSPLARLGGRPGAIRVHSPGKDKAAIETKSYPAAKPTPGLLVRPSEILARPSAILARPSTLLAKPSELLVRPTAVLGAPTSVAARRQERFVAESAALPSIAGGLPNIPLLDLSVPAPLCANDEARIRNYAARIAGSVGLKIEDDLKLFGLDDRPLPNLRPVMLAMSNVELGTLRAGPALVEAAIERLGDRAIAASTAGMASP